MNPEPSMLPERDEQLGEILAAWIEAAERGEAPDSAEWLARHASFAPELAQFLANRARLQEAAEPLRQAVQAMAAVAPSSRATPDPTSQESTGALPAAEMIGRSVGEHDLLEEIGQGGMGLVYRARHRRLQRLVALKMLRTNVLSAAGDVQRFRNEAEVLAQLDHPHIVPIHDVGEHEGRVYFSMKLIEGGGLDGQLERFRDDPQGAARLVAQVARAVHHAHQRGILHRDLKPSNILLDREGQPHVSDFGLSKRIESDGSLTQTGAIVGTPQYMAPEQTSGRKGAVTTATDVYGLGAVLYAILTGRSPFQGETVLETLEQVREREPEPPRRSNTKVDRDLETVCLKCLQKESQRRYESAQALVEDLERWLSGDSIRARRASRWERLNKWMRRRPTLAALVLVTALSIMGYIGGLLWYNLQLQESAWREHQLAEEATRQRDVAREQRRLARKAVDKMYSEVAEKWLANQPDMQGLQKQFLEEALRFYQEFADAEANDPSARAEKGRAYLRVARISTMLGDQARAKQNCTNAIIAFRELADEFPEDPEYPYELSACHRLRAISQNAGLGTGDLQHEIEDGRQAVALLEPLVIRFPVEPRFQEALAMSLINLSNPVMELSIQEAEALRRRALVVAENIVKDFPSRMENLRSLAWAYHNHAECSAAGGKVQEAVEEVRKSIEASRLLMANPSSAQVYGRNRLPTDWLNLGERYRDLGTYLGQLRRFAEAQDALQQALKIHEKLQRDFPESALYRPYIGSDQCALGQLYDSMGQAHEADKAYQGALDSMERMLHDFPTKWAYHNTLARFLVTCPRHRFRDAPRALRIARKVVEAMPEYVHFWNTLGIAYYQTGDYRAARDALNEATRLRLGSNSYDFYYLAMVHQRLGDKQEARKCYQKAAQGMDKTWPRDDELLRLGAEASALLGIEDGVTTRNEETAPAKESDRKSGKGGR